MVERLMDESCADFAEALAAKRSVPGGGAAAALAGALAAALCSMAGNFTVGKKEHVAVEDDVERLVSDADAARARLLDLVDEDARAFEPLSRAYGIPKGERGRERVLEEATAAAIDPPLKMMRELCALVELLEEMGSKGSRMLLSDVGCGASLAKAALEMAGANVFVNTASLSDRVSARRIEDECDELLSEYLARADAVVRFVVDSIRGRN